MKTQDFDYRLPTELIAQSPARYRQEARLLVVEGAEHGVRPVFKDQQFSDFVDYCNPGDLLIVNDTRVVPARLLCQRPTGGKVEVMLERFISKHHFLALASANRPLKPGQILLVDGQQALRFVQRVGVFFQFELLAEFKTEGLTLFKRYGDIPLPPYIKRRAEQQDKARYQTVYAHTEGAVAAPTAGLHFTNEILQQLAEKGVERAHITLHVGAGTFQPVKVEDIKQHKMHQEWVEVNSALVNKIAQTKANGKRVIAVGTTTVRALESAALSGKIDAFCGPTDIFIYPGFCFKVVDCLLTNFHLPKSTLLMMISAFSGFECIRSAYAHAIEQQYRFFSYGDAMLLTLEPQAATAK